MKIVDCVQGSPSWFAARRGKPTASNFHRIITPKTGKASAGIDGLAYELVADLFRTTEPLESEVYQNAAMRHGIDTEPMARHWYEMQADLDVQQVGFCLTDDERFGASPDGLVGSDGGCEWKCPDGKTQVEYLHQGVLPPDYKAQVHGGLIVTGREWWDFVAFHPGLPTFKIRVYPDDYTDALRKCMEQFYARFLEIKAIVEARLT